MSHPLVILEAALFCLGFAGVGLLSLAEAALVSASKAELARMAEEGDERARLVLRLREGRGEFITAIIIGINCCIIMVSTTATLLYLRYSAGQEWDEPTEKAIHAAVHIGTLFALLLLAELTPKAYAVRRPEAAAVAVVRPTRALMTTLTGVVRVLGAAAGGLLRLVGGRRGHLVTEEEIRSAADVAEEEGIVAPEERDMMERIIELRDTTVREVMVPRVDVVALPTSATVDDVISAVQEHGLSRFPLYEDDIDDVVGILYVNHLLPHLVNGANDVKLAEVARPPVFAPESKKLDKLFDELRAAKVHMAVVIDEYGATEGIVSMEDILEEIVGEIADEHDVPLEEIVAVSDTEAVVDARVTIDDVNERLETYFPEGQYDTLGGFVLEQASRIPEVGDEVRWENLRIIVVEREGPRLGRLRVLRDPPGGILRRNDEEIVARGSLTIGELQQVLGDELRAPAEQTLGELVAEEAEDDPERGAKMSWGGFELTVLEANGDRVHKVRIVGGRG